MAASNLPVPEMNYQLTVDGTDSLLEIEMRPTPFDRARRDGPESVFKSS